MRISHECSLHELNGNTFATLTYRPIDECTKAQKQQKLHIPEDWSLHVDHFQKFMKRLRKAYPDQKIKYFHAGEYGNTCRHGFNLERQKCPLCNLGRPHYHACLFNLSFEDAEPYASDDGVTRYTSPKLENIWKYGFVDISQLEFKSAAYVARYCLKKINGVNQEEHYKNITDTGEVIPVIPEYATMSNGVGKQWYEKYKTDLFPSDEVPVPGQGVFKKVPRYYETLYGAEEPTKLEEVKEKRIKFRDENIEEYSPQRLMSKYKVKKAQSKMLKRS